jgi:GrpB-like predicted nucleotidyltransferase (UPF0157 family)
MPMSDDWFMKFSNTKKVKIVPHNPLIKTIFEEFKQILIKQLGNVEIKHMGASALSISGQGEIDLYIPTTPTKFKVIIKKLTKIYGKPGSLDFDWARFNHTYKNTDFEIMVMHKNCPDYQDNVKLFNYLKTNPSEAKKYEQLKEKYAKISKREYYKQKGIFIRKILQIK